MLSQIKNKYERVCGMELDISPEPLESILRGYVTLRPKGLSFCPLSLEQMKRENPGSMLKPTFFSTEKISIFIGSKAYKI